MPDVQAELEQLLATLAGAGVEFILIGGAAALIQGAPITTQDLDIVHRRDPTNVARLLTTLEQLDASMLDLARRKLPPTAEGLQGRGQTLMTTKLGRLDALGPKIAWSCRSCSSSPASAPSRARADHRCVQSLIGRCETSL